MLPDNALDFMRRNVVLVGRPFAGSGLKWAKLERTQWNFFSGNVYTLADAGGEGRSHFQIYWCHYDPDAVRTCPLSNEANLMFTPGMTGCTFGIGMPASDGTVLVGHSNIKDSGDQVINSLLPDLGDRNITPERFLELNESRLEIIRSLQLKGIVDAFEEKRGIIDTKIETKLDTNNQLYKQSGNPVTTFGVRDENNVWKFYFQVRDARNQVRGVHEIKN